MYLLALKKDLYLVSLKACGIKASGDGFTNVYLSPNYQVVYIKHIQFSLCPSDLNKVV